MRDGSQSTCMLFYPRIDGGIPLDSAVESQQFRSHRGYPLLLWGYGFLSFLSRAQSLGNSSKSRTSAAKSAHG
jgi:hypothetical protein